MQRNYCWIRRNSKAALLYVSLATPAQSAHPQFGRCQATPGRPPKYEVPPVLLGEKKSVPDRSLATVFYEAHNMDLIKLFILNSNATVFFGVFWRYVFSVFF